MKPAACALALFFVGGALGACRGPDRESEAATDGVAPPSPAESCALAPAATTSSSRPPIDMTPARPPVREPGRRTVLPTDVSLVAVGDSLTYGQGSSYPGGFTSYPAVLGQLLGIHAINVGVPGHTSKDLPDVDYLLMPGKQNRLVVMIGTNDIHGGLGATAAETYARLARYVAAREASGWLVTVNTPPKSLIATADTDRVAEEYEAMIRAGFSRVADVAASPLIGRGDPAGPDRAYYADEVGHLNNAGYAALAKIVKESPAPAGEPPKLMPWMGVPRDGSLTAWFRDLVQCSVVPSEIDRPVKWLDMAEENVFRGTLDAWGPDRPTRVASAINGRPALRFNGPGTGFYLPQDRLTSDFIRTSELVISVVMRVENVSSASSAPYDNDGVFSDSRTRIGMSVKRPNTVTAFTYDGKSWARSDGTIPLDSPVVVSMRLLNGKLGLRVNTTGAWSETPAAIDALSNGVLRIGTDSTNQKTFSGLIADVVIRKAYCAATMAADDAYFRARYGVP
jgi:lysophospholipase L1-like esterase